MIDFQISDTDLRAPGAHHDLAGCASALLGALLLRETLAAESPDLAAFGREQVRTAARTLALAVRLHELNNPAPSPLDAPEVGDLELRSPGPWHDIGACRAELAAAHVEYDRVGHGFAGLRVAALGRLEKARANLAKAERWAVLRAAGARTLDEDSAAGRAQETARGAAEAVVEARREADVEARALARGEVQ